VQCCTTTERQVEWQGRERKENKVGTSRSGQVSEVAAAATAAVLNSKLTNSVEASL